jgi:hypothetical protein
MSPIDEHMRYGCMRMRISYCVDLQLGVGIFLKGRLECALFVVDARMCLVQLATARAHHVHVHPPRREDAHQHGWRNVLMQL